MYSQCRNVQSTWDDAANVKRTLMWGCMVTGNRTTFQRYTLFCTFARIFNKKISFSSY